MRSLPMSARGAATSLAQTAPDVDGRAHSDSDPDAGRGDLPRARQGHSHQRLGGDARRLLDTVPITEPGSRAWNYVTLGLGHPGGATFWADFVYNLRAAGYDGTLNIEHEDALVNSVEGVGRAADLLKQVALVEPADWTPANV